MARLIDADAFIAEHCADCKYANVNGICTKEAPLCGSVQIVTELPTIDAVEVVHGRWIPHNKGTNNWVECSECNTVGSPFWKRCPVCEAKMDGERKDNE